MLVYRKLPPEEWGKLRPLFEQLDQFLPDALMAQAAVVEVDGHIVGFQMLQMIPHAEPHWEHPAWRGKIDALRLHDLAVPNNATNHSLCVPGVLAIATDRNVESLLEYAGYHRFPGTVWIKDLRKKEAVA